ncbi:hypothetical protein NFJ02_40g106270 [Pycnococcus provasolii]
MAACGSCWRWEVAGSSAHHVRGFSTPFRLSPRHRSEGFGHRTANAHSLIHGYPLVYGWDAGYPLFTSANSLDSVGGALKQYVRRFRLHDNTVFSTTITSCRQINNGNASSSSSLSLVKLVANGNKTLLAKHVLVCSGHIGKTRKVEDMYDTTNFRGELALAESSPTSPSWSHLRVANKNVVIIGDGPYGIEALRCAFDCKAESVRMISRRPKLVFPYAPSLVLLATNLPFLHARLRTFVARATSTSCAAPTDEACCPKSSSAKRMHIFNAWFQAQVVGNLIMLALLVKWCLGGFYLTWHT